MSIIMRLKHYFLLRNIILITFGVGLLLFTSFFVFTGFDELWNGINVWWYGVGIAGLMTSIGLTSIIIAIQKSLKAPRILLYTTLGSLAIIFIEILQFV